MKDPLIAGITTLAGSSLGSITIATVPVAVTTTVPAGGIAGLLGFTTTVTTVVASPIIVPVGGILALGALLTYIKYEVNKSSKNQEPKS
jgi:hypothetical protein